jgi:class 3 adenylate cyclase
MEMTINFIEDLLEIKEFNPKFIIPGITEMKTGFPSFMIFEGMKKYFHTDYDGSFEIFNEMESRSDEILGISLYYERIFYHCLSAIHVYEKSKDEKQLEKINALLNEMKSLSTLGKYFMARFNILCIVLKSVQDTDFTSIINEFESAISFAQKNSLIVPSAVASSILFYYTIKMKLPDTICKIYFENTITLWDSVQAKRMISNLKSEFPKYSLNRKNVSDSTLSISVSSTVEMSPDDSLDMISIVKTSQALSVELSLSTLVTQVMKIVLENVGAERGVLLMLEKDDLILKAIADPKNVTLMNESINNSRNVLCHTLVDITKATKKEIILENASNSSYSQNSYILRNHSKSIFVHPILKGKNLIGIIYLENNSIEGTFSINRKIALGHISSQLAISYENATLYEKVSTLNKSYERFLPKEFLNQLGKGDVTKIRKGDATTKKMSILFSDIRGFTNLTEKMNSEESFSFVNEILSHLAPIISKNNGFIDKFLGDCIMALFPFYVDDSVKCGIEMTKELEVYNNTIRKGLPPVQMGIGINYGSCMIGTLGAEERLDGTVISDAVNTASRVESLTKTLGTPFVVTKEVIENLTIEYPNRCIGKYLLKGKENPMTLYQFMPDSSDLQMFEIGLKEFGDQNFSKAKKIFDVVDDKTSNYLSNVCSLYDGFVFPNEWCGEIKIDKDGNPEKIENEALIERKVKKLTQEEKETLFDELVKEKKVDILKLISLKYSTEIEEIIKNKF